MRHESIRSLRWDWIGFGWFIAVALTSLLLLAMDGFGIMVADRGDETLWVAIAILVGFLVTGFFVGTRVVAAPTLHGIAIGLLSVVAWLGINLVLGEPSGEASWRALDAGSLAGLLLLQAVAAIVGARLGVRWRRTPASTV